MPKSYELDDILEEIKRKKSAMAEASPAVPSAAPAAWEEPEGIPTPEKEALPPEEELPRQSSSPLDGLADFFGSDAKFDIGASDKPKQKEKAVASRNLRGDRALRRDSSARKEPAPDLSREIAPEPAHAPVPEREMEQRPAFRLDLDLDRWDEPEPVRDESLDKTQLNIPVPSMRPQPEEEDLSRTRSIPAQSQSRGFDFEGLQRTLREQEDYPAERLYIPDEPEPVRINRDGEIDDYRSPADAASIRQDLKESLFSLNIRLGVTSVLFAMALYFTLARWMEFPLPAFMEITEQPRIFIIVNLAVVIIGALVCNTTVGGGLAALLTMRADSDSMAALAVLSTIVQGVAAAVFPQQFVDLELGLFFTPAMLGLWFNLLGKRMLVARIEKNFPLIATEKEKKAVLYLKNKELARELSRGMDLIPPSLAYSCKANLLTRFLEQSYEPDSSEGLFRVIAPVVTVCSLAVGGVSFYITREMLTALTSFAAVVCISSPITATLYANLPLRRAQKSLNREGIQLSGFEAVDLFSSVNGVVVDASELFPSDNVLLHNIKMFEQRRIDEAILDASSALCSFDGTIKNVFMKIIQGDMQMLKTVENLIYEEGMGLSAWVDGKRVLIGNSALMRHHEIYTPSADYEAKYRTGGRDLIYLSNSGELTAMFIISYRPDPQIAAALYQLERRGIGLIVRSTDPNLTAEKIAQVYDLPLEMVHVIPAKLHGEFDLITNHKDTAFAGLSFLGGASGLFHGVSAAVSVKGAVMLASVLQIVGVLLGYGIMAVFTLLGGMENANGMAVMAFQLLWGAGTILFSNLRRI